MTHHNAAGCAIETGCWMSKKEVWADCWEADTLALGKGLSADLEGIGPRLPDLGVWQNNVKFYAV